MSGIAGFAGYHESLWEERYLWASLGKRMGKRLSHRGSGETGARVSKNCVLAGISHPVQPGPQPLTLFGEGTACTVVFDGELYRTRQLREQLTQKGHSFEGQSDAELALRTYLTYGLEAPLKLEGTFAFVIDDERASRTVLFRDRFGHKPLFYTLSGDRLVFGSEIKALFEYPGTKAALDREGLSEIFALSPGRKPGSGIFKGILEVLPGHSLCFDKDGVRTAAYYRFPTEGPEHSYEEAVACVRRMLEETVAEQIDSSMDLCAFLSGGLDSAVVAAMAQAALKPQDRPLSTYSLLLEQDDSSFYTPPFEDSPWAALASEALGTEHHSLRCCCNTLFFNLYDAVIARDLPAMGERDSALLAFCRDVKKQHSAALCGECADLLFGDPPYRTNAGGFPWLGQNPLRQELLKPELAAELKLANYTDALAMQAGDPARLHINWFLPCLLERLDRCGMHSGLLLKTPYTDHSLVEYLYYCPPAYQNRNGVCKALLRDAAADYLPESLLFRKHSPFPSANDPVYGEMLKTKLGYILRDSLQPLHKVIDSTAVTALLNRKWDKERPWFSQLMSNAQAIAWLVQLNYWMLRYHVYVDL